MKKTPSSSLMRAAVASLAILSFATVSQATPFASCITNSGTGGTNVSFYLNEAGATVTITYNDGSTNASFNGVTTGTNLPAGVQNFSLAGFTSYSISVFKNGSGSPSVIASSPGISNTRGVDANKIPTSPYFGHIYDVQADIGVWLLNPDLSLIKSAQTAGVGFPFGDGSTTTASPDWVAVAPDGTVMVTDEGFASSAIYQMAPDFSSAKLFLGPTGATNTSHGDIVSRAILTGSISNGNAVLYDVDGDLGSPGSIQVYDIGSGPLPWTNAPNYEGAQISIPGFTAQTLGGNEYAGFTMGPNGYIYGSTYRGTFGSANYVTITDSTGSNVLWSSEGQNGYPLVGTPPTGDWFDQPEPSGGAYPGGLEGTSAVSPDGKYLVGASIDNYFIIAPLTNGIPNTSAIFTVAPTSYVGSGRGVAWDAADNILWSSSGIGLVQEWSLGITATAVTTGNSSGPTGFSLTSPSTTVSVVATTPNASQGGVNGTVGTPVPGVFTITRTSTNGYASAQTVNYVLSGTATEGASGAYTVLSTSAVTIPAGQSNVTVTINPTTNNVPRATTTVILSLAGGAGYSVAAPFIDTVTIQNTSSQEILLSTGAASMYKAFSNDFASVVLNRLGDTNAASYTISGFTYAGTAVLGTDYTALSNITFNPGDLAYTNQIFPLVGGVPPVDTVNPTYIGNLTAIIGLSSGGSSFSNAPGTVTLTSIDNANPPATVLWSNPLTSASDSNNWIITAANDNMALDATNYEVNFGYDLTSANPNYFLNGAGNGIIAYPPSGATTCLRITCNKDGTAHCGGGVNAFPTNAPMFSGNYAVRFYMNVVQGANDGAATEGPLFGINHLSLGVTTNWFTGSGFTSYLTNGAVVLNQWADDGVWFWMDGQAGGEADGDYVQFTGISHTFPNTGFSATIHGVSAVGFENNFKYPNPFNTDPAYNVTGIPANESANAAVNINDTPATAWADVEIKQINGLVTLSIDKIPILVYTNISGWTSGLPMLGYEDPFDSIQDESSAAFYSNIRVVQIGAPVITEISVSGGLVIIDFTTTDGDDTTSSFTLQGSPTASTLVYPTVTGTFTQLGTGAFQVTTPLTASKTEYYRIKHN